MCGIVAYFGGAGNNLTRVLSGMSAIAYRAPDSTGVGVFGDDGEPIRTRKSLGSVTSLLEVIHNNALYPSPESQLLSFLSTETQKVNLGEQQRRFLEFEGLPLDIFESIHRGKVSYPTFDELVKMNVENPIRLTPGWPGRPTPNPTFLIRSKIDLRTVIQELVSNYDLSPVVIQTMIRNALSETIGRKKAEETLEVDAYDILRTFDRLFDRTLAGERISIVKRLENGQFPISPYAQKYLWRYLKESPIEIPSDYDRDGVRCIFRLLDAALLSRLSHRPDLRETLQEILEINWPEMRRIGPVEWRSLYGTEKAANVFGWAAATALTYLQREELLQELLITLSSNDIMNEPSIVPGQTDPICLRFFTPPILAHGRWAIQSPVTVRNAHPFLDEKRQRSIVVNGQFDGQVEEKLRAFLERVGKFSFRTENSGEYVALLWGYYFELLQGEKIRYENIRSQVEAGLEDLNIGSQAIDYQIFHQVKDSSLEDLDERAFIEAVKRISQNGGQVAAAGMSLFSPHRLYVASHNRPVFVAHRLDNDDFMVVSDINAALGLFPQKLIYSKMLKLMASRKAHDSILTTLKKKGAIKSELKTHKKTQQEEEKKLLEIFKVAVYPLDGQEIVAKVETLIEKNGLTRRVVVSDFEGRPLHDIEPITTVLIPEMVRKDLHRSYHETHLHEIPDRMSEILRFYEQEDGALPSFDLKTSLFRRRFGRNFSSLKRLVLAGTGSAYHMAIIAKNFIHALIPELDVLVLRPGEFEDLSNVIAPEKDLVILLSWSSTTADMVQIAKRLISIKAVTVGITEKLFADMALWVKKSAGVIPILSGEEVTISGIKSTICMLFCLELFCLWIAFQKGKGNEALLFLHQLEQLPEEISKLLADDSLDDFSRTLASKYAGTRASIIVDALNSTGTGREAALKLEEISWSAIGKAFDYRDFLHLDLEENLKRSLVLVNATHQNRLHEAIQVMEKLYQIGVEFAAISYPNRNQEFIETYSNRQCVFLPRLEGPIQPFVDLIFYYRLSFYFGVAHGRDLGEPPRNRVKSLTVSRNLPDSVPSAARELFRIKEMNRLKPIDTDIRARLERQSIWEQETSTDPAKTYYRELRHLALILDDVEAFDKLFTFDPKDLALLGNAVFTEKSDIGEIIFVPMDRDADAAARNSSGHWSRFLGFPVRVVSLEEPLSNFSEETLVILTAATSPKKDLIDDRLRSLNCPFVWFGAYIDFLEDYPKDSVLGGFQMKKGFEHCPCDILYAGINLLFIAAWNQITPEKANIVGSHFKIGANLIEMILNDRSLKDAARMAITANKMYHTAFFIGPPSGCGLFMADRFDQSGKVFLAYHPFGESAHGPLVTVDPKVENKFVKLIERYEMVSLYNEDQVKEWERTYLDGNSIDDFLHDPFFDSFQRLKTPFFAEGNWYLPVLRPDYDATNDNLIIMDATSERYFDLAIDELATFGCRHARIVVITQEAFQYSSKRNALYKHPIGNLILLPFFRGETDNLPVSDFLLPFAMNLLAVEMTNSVPPVKPGL
jgi:glucosamine 6-phosphate synthetase-like amidotransferase/phosphosugar isomerase protein